MSQTYLSLASFEFMMYEMSWPPFAVMTPDHPDDVWQSACVCMCVRVHLLLAAVSFGGTKVCIVAAWSWRHFSWVARRREPPQSAIREQHIQSHSQPRTPLIDQFSVHPFQDSQRNKPGSKLLQFFFFPPRFFFFLFQEEYTGFSTRRWV